MKTISVHELKRRLDNGDVTLICVFDPVEYDREHIDGDYLIPLREISQDKLPSKEHTVVTYCRVGRRSEEARKILVDQDPKLEVYSLDGGILAWKDAGYSVKPQNE